jgi:hypothetical protein
MTDDQVVAIMAAIFAQPYQDTDDEGEPVTRFTDYGKAIEYARQLLAEARLQLSLDGEALKVGTP